MSCSGPLSASHHGLLSHVDRLRHVQPPIWHVNRIDKKKYCTADLDYAGDTSRIARTYTSATMNSIIRSSRVEMAMTSLSFETVQLEL